ncbi:hypothetical protein BsWGS_15893 [Bradybaena similaris]
MGNFNSKHECFFVSADLSKTLEDKIWKKKTGFNLANYNMDETLSELSICLQETTENSQLRVDLPPQKLETETSKVLKLDHLTIGSHGNNDNNERSKLNIEEFECGLQFESCENAKQEWSVTLYDFDGRGRITKEDLSSLLKALYDAVGSSIRLPPNGAKTLKLRLSVGQDTTSQMHHSANPKSAERSKNTTKPAKNKVREFSKLNNLTRTQVKCTNENLGQSSVVTAQDYVATQNLDKKPSQQQPESQQAKPDHQQLADLVQENMERNQIRQLRRHHSDSRNEGQQHHKRRHRITGTHCPVTTVCAALSATMKAVIAEGGGNILGAVGGGGLSGAADDTTDDKPKESQDRRNYYLDLAGIDSKSKFQNNPTVPVAGSGCVKTSTGHCRSRSHDVAAGAKADSGGVGTDIKCDNTSLEKCDNIRRESERLGSKHGRLDQQHPRSKSFDPQEVTGQMRSPKSHQQPSSDPNPGSRRFRPVSLPGHVPVMVSPHHHRRHRHREKDHDMAMQQVAQWIEREHPWDMNGERLIVQRHEHHHIHEHHHHHHYHHYYEA